MNTDQPTQYEKEAEFASDPHARPGRWEIRFNVPPVCTWGWDAKAWVAHAEACGGVWRRAAKDK